MAVSEVSKVQLVGLQSDQDAIFELLQESQVIELIGDAAHEVVIQDLEYNIAQISFAISLIDEYSAVKVPLMKKLQGGKARLHKESIIKTEAEFDHTSLTKTLTGIDEQLTEARNIVAKNTEDIEVLSSWRTLTVAPADVQATQLTTVTLGSLPLQAFGDFKLAVTEVTDKFEVIVVSQTENNMNVLIVMNTAVSERLLKVLDEHGFTAVDLPQADSVPKDAIDRLQAEIAERKLSIESLVASVSEYAKDLDKLKISFDALTWKKTRIEANRFVKNTDRTFQVKFWVPTEQLKALQGHLEKISTAVEFTELEIDEDEDIPVPLKNSSLFSPFESITGIYGVPKADEPDPTPLLAPFFVVYFGLALTDAAYGIILAIGAYAAMKFLKLPKESRKLFIVLIWGGVSTFIFGALFGGWFGIEFGALPEFLQNIRVIDSLSDPILVLILTMVLGIFQVMIGIAIKAWWDIKHKRITEALLDSGIWLVFLGSIVLWILATVEMLPAATAKIFLYMILAATAGLVLTQGRDNKNPLLKIAMGILSLYGLVGYFSDVLSYSRLLALGLSTAIIASVVNLVAFLFMDMIPWAPLGWVVAIIILVGGHIFNMAINVLGAYIHSGRLQFVEFFPKFMEGGGRRFRPFAKESKYVQVVKETA